MSGPDGVCYDSNKMSQKPDLNNQTVILYGKFANIKERCSFVSSELTEKVNSLVEIFCHKYEMQICNKSVSLKSVWDGVSCEIIHYKSGNFCFEIAATSTKPEEIENLESQNEREFNPIDEGTAGLIKEIRDLAIQCFEAKTSSAIDARDIKMMGILSQDVSRTLEGITTGARSITFIPFI